jgi:hypothetical protein
MMVAEVGWLKRRVNFWIFRKNFMNLNLKKMGNLEKIPKKLSRLVLIFGLYAPIKSYPSMHA